MTSKSRPEDCWPSLTEPTARPPAPADAQARWRTDAAQLAAARDAATWHALDARARASAATSWSPEKHPTPKLDCAHLTDQGYAHVRSAWDQSALARAAITTTLDDGWPAVFAFALDCLWEALACPRLLRAIAPALGTRPQLVPLVWAHHVPAESGRRGWSPHVDYPGRAVAEVDAYRRLTLWLPLSGASRDGAPIFVLPRPQAPSWVPHLDAQEYVPTADVLRIMQAARPLYCAPGDALLWRYDLLHWGGAHAGTEPTPRLSIALEVAAEDAPVLVDDDARIPWGTTPALADRLRIISRSVGAFARAADREPFAARFMALARALDAGPPSGDI